MSHDTFPWLTKRQRPTGLHALNVRTPSHSRCHSRVAVRNRRELITLMLFTLSICWLSHHSQACASDSPATPDLPIETYRLENGLKVALSHTAGAPRTTICVTYHVGSKNERAGLTGFAHFFEHMMFRGTKNVPNYDSPLREAGTSPNAFTSQDVTVYFETVPNNYMERALYLEAERMGFLSSALDQQKFDTEREVVKNERRQRMENVPYGLANEALSSLVYPKGHPYSWSVIGSMKDLNSATLDDLKRFFFEFYHPRNATLTLVGGFEPAAAKSVIETYFGPLAPGPEVKPIQIPETRPQASRVVQKDQVKFPRLYWAWPTVDETNPDAAPLDLLAMLLSSGDASRLKKSLVVDAQAAVQASASSITGELGGMFVISATAAPGHSIDDLEALVAAELKRLATEPPSDEELSRVKTKHRTGQLTGMTSPQRRAFAIAMGYAQYDDPHFYKTYFTDYAKVTTTDIERVAHKYLVDQKVVLVIEPVKPGEEESEALLAGPLPSTKSTVQFDDRQPTAGPDWSQLPPPSERQDFAPPTFQQRQLKNGMNVWIAPWHVLPLVSTNLLVFAGTGDDPVEQAGLASLTAELWSQGTQDLTSTELAEALDALGTSFRVGAGADTSQLRFTVEKGAFDSAMGYLAQIVASPRFDPSDFQRERELKLNGLVSGPDNVSWIAGRVFPQLLFGRKHPYGTPGQGYTDTVQQLTVDEVKNFYQSNFSPQNATLIVVGDVEIDPLMELLESTVGRWQADADKHARPAPESMGQPDTVYLVDKPGAVQSMIVVGRLWKDRKDPSYFATEVGNRVLGGEFSSRINQNLRQKNGYTYGANSGFRYQRGGGSWLVSSSVRAEVTGKALKEVMFELRRAGGDAPLTEAEISTAREAELNSFPQSFETPSGIARAMADLAIYGLPHDYFRHYTRAVEDTESAAIAKVMAELVNPASMVMLVVGDRESVVPQLQEEGFEKIELLSTDGAAKQPK